MPPRRSDARQAHMAARLAADGTPAERMAAAFDVFRQAVVHAARAGQPTDAAVATVTACLTDQIGRLQPVTATGGSAVESAA